MSTTVMVRADLVRGRAPFCASGSGNTIAEVDRKVDEAMKQDPRLWLLIMNCSTDDGSLNLGASNSSKSSDIAFGPHTYVIASDPKAGEFGK